MRFKSILAAAALAGAFAAFAAPPALAQAPGPVCANCHEQAYKSTVLTAHGARNDAAGTACAACHTGIAEHAKDPMKVKPVGPLTSKTSSGGEKSAVCLTCHAGNRNMAFWQQGTHRKMDVSCNDCHAIHGPTSRRC
jgi:hypothetical protein